MSLNHAERRRAKRAKIRAQQIGGGSAGRSEKPIHMEPESSPIGGLVLHALLVVIVEETLRRYFPDLLPWGWMLIATLVTWDALPQSVRRHVVSATGLFINGPLISNSSVAALIVTALFAGYWPVIQLVSNNLEAATAREQSATVSQDLIKKWLGRFQISVTPTPIDPRVDFRFEVTMPDRHSIAVAVLRALPGYVMLSATLRTDPGTKRVLDHFSAEQLVELRNMLMYELSKSEITSSLTTQTSSFDNLFIYKRIAIAGLTEEKFIEDLDAMDSTVTHIAVFMALRMHEIEKSLRHP